jgi:biopolymer transport protein ExbD
MMSSNQLIVALVCVASIISRPLTVGSQQKACVTVLLPHVCPTGGAGDRRDLVVRYLPDAKLWLNSEPLDEYTLRLKLRTALATRVERLVWVAADERVSYGEVVAIISKLTEDSPDLHVALVTKAQIGPVDPSDIEFRRSQLNPKLGIYNLCVQVKDHARGKL